MGLDSAKYRKYNEQGSDMARTQFEKATGKDIPDKVRGYSFFYLTLVHCHMMGARVQSLAVAQWCEWS